MIDHLTTPNNPTGDITINTGAKLDTTASNYNITVSRLNLQGGELKANNSTITLTGTSGVLLTNNSGLLTYDTSTVVMNPDTDFISPNFLTSGTVNFYTLQLTPTMTASRTYTFGAGIVNIYNNFDVNPDSTGGTKNLNVYLGGATTVTATTTISDIGNTTSVLDTVSGSNYDFASGALNIVAASNSFVANNSNITLTGDYVNNGTFTAGNSVLTLNGSGLQTLSGIMTSASAFYHLTMTNASAAGIQFNDSATVTGTFADNTQDSKLTFTTTKTFTFANIDIDGAVDHPIVLTSTNAVPGTPAGPQWFFNVSQISPTVSYVSVYDSDALGGNQIDASNNGFDGGNNENWNFSANTAPNSPSDLVQKKNDDTVIAQAGWINELSVKYTATVSDTDNPDTLYLCVEKDPVGTAFSGTEDACGTGVAYAGTPATLDLTISSQTDATEYHWQARAKDTAGAYSSWVSYGTNTDPNDRDYGLDTTAPTGGTVGDGAAGDQDWNNGSLTSLQSNWSGFDTSASGLLKYEYAIRRASDGYYWGSGWQAGENWYDNGTNTTATVNSMNLNTSENYYFSVKAYDNAGNMETSVSSDGQQVLPTLSFSYDSNTITFDNLNSTNNYTDAKTNTFTTSTNASSGYAIQGFITQDLTSLANPSKIITNFSYNGASWSLPQLWPAGEYGFGYTSNDTSVQGSNRFAGATKYAPFVGAAPGDVVADHTAVVNGTTGAVEDEEFIVTYKVAVSTAQDASTYQTYAVYFVTANY